MFRDKAKKKGGNPIPGIVSIVSGLNAWIATPIEKRWGGGESFFVLEIAKDLWEEMNETAQKALVDRYLYRMDRDIDTGDLIIVPPDIEESTVVVHRHGLYNADLKNFVKAGAKHLTLLELIEEREDLFNAGETVEMELGPGQSMTVTRMQLLSALAKLDIEAKAGVTLDRALDDMCEQVNEGGILNSVAHDGTPVTVTMSRG